MGERRSKRILQGVDGPWLHARILVVALLLFLLGWQFGHVEAAPIRYTHAEILSAIRMVESSGRDRPPDGDGGKAIGPFQIHRVYWTDARLRGDYQDCRRREYAERVVIAYMKRYAKTAWQQRDAEVIARVHNGGPKGAGKQATLKYWKRVQAQLQKQRGG